MPTERRKLSKEAVNYREKAQRNNGGRQCGNCAMFNPPSNSCDLVKGFIRPIDVCDRWVAQNASIK